MVTDYLAVVFYLIQRCLSAGLTLQHSLLKIESLATCLLLLLLLLTYPGLQLQQLLFLPAVLTIKDLYLLVSTQRKLFESNPLFIINQMESGDLDDPSPVCAAPAVLCVPAGETSPAPSCCSVKWLPLGPWSSYIPLRQTLSALFLPQIVSGFSRDTSN